MTNDELRSLVREQIEWRQVFHVLVPRAAAVPWECTRGSTRLAGHARVLSVELALPFRRLTAGP